MDSWIKSIVVFVIIVLFAPVVIAGSNDGSVNAGGTTRTNDQPNVAKIKTVKELPITVFAKTNAVFKAYSEYFVEKISTNWFELCDTTLGAEKSKPVGEVVLEFNLTPNGMISNMRVRSAAVDEKYASLCEMAISNCIPFDPWSKEMRKIYTNSYSPVHFTFEYYSAM